MLQTFRQLSRIQVDPPKLFEKIITIQKPSGNPKITAIYEDSQPPNSNSNPLGTVIAFHGSPGSHNDFKYIRQYLDQMNIRFIGLNYPGFSYSKSYAGQDFGNVERQLFSDQLIDELGISGKIVFMGHSRGCENTLQTAVERKAHGLVLINPFGLRRHRGISPEYKLRYVTKIYDLLPKTIADLLIYKIYRSMKFHIHCPEECISALRSVNDVMLEKQLEFIEKLNSLENTRILISYAGRDQFIESKIMEECLEKYENLEALKFQNDPDIDQICDVFEKNAKASVFVKKDDHFQNKSRAEMIARSVQAILKN